MLSIWSRPHFFVLLRIGLDLYIVGCIPGTGDYSCTFVTEKYDTDQYEYTKQMPNTHCSTHLWSYAQMSTLYLIINFI